MFIADSQAHLWKSVRPVKTDPERQHDKTVFGKAEALKDMDAVGVARLVIIGGEHNNDYQLEVARELPDRFAVVGRLNLDMQESRDQLAHWKEQRGMLGLRISAVTGQTSLETEGRAHWVWSAAERAGVPIMIWLPGSLSLIEDVAGRHPGLKLTIDHMGIGRNAKGPGTFAHIPELVALAKYSNISVKTSGLPAHSSEPYPFRDLDPHIHRVVDAFGPQRVFWGSDITRMPVSYRQCITHFTEELPWLNERDKELIMGHALCDWIGWK